MAQEAQQAWQAPQGSLQEALRAWQQALQEWQQTPQGSLQEEQAQQERAWQRALQARQQAPQGSLREEQAQQEERTREAWQTQQALQAWQQAQQAWQQAPQRSPQVQQEEPTQQAWQQALQARQQAQAQQEERTREAWQTQQALQAWQQARQAWQQAQALQEERACHAWHAWHTWQAWEAQASQAQRPWAQHPRPCASPPPARLHLQSSQLWPAYAAQEPLSHGAPHPAQPDMKAIPPWRDPNNGPPAAAPRSVTTEARATASQRQQTQHVQTQQPGGSQSTEHQMRAVHPQRRERSRSRNAARGHWMMEREPLLMLSSILSARSARMLRREKIKSSTEEIRLICFGEGLLSKLVEHLQLKEIAELEQTCQSHASTFRKANVWKRDGLLWTRTQRDLRLFLQCYSTPLVDLRAVVGWCAQDLAECSLRRFLERVRGVLGIEVSHLERRLSARMDAAAYTRMLDFVLEEGGGAVSQFTDGAATMLARIFGWLPDLKTALTLLHHLSTRDFRSYLDEHEKEEDDASGADWDADCLAEQAQTWLLLKACRGRLLGTRPDNHFSFVSEDMRLSSDLDTPSE